MAGLIFPGSQSGVPGPVAPASPGTGEKCKVHEVRRPGWARKSVGNAEGSYSLRAPALAALIPAATQTLSLIASKGRTRCASRKSLPLMFL